MKHLMIEFFGTFTICFCVSLCNIASYKDNEVSLIMPALVYGILILIFSQISRGHSKGFFNPYYSIFEILSGRLSVERGISNTIYTIHSILYNYRISVTNISICVFSVCRWIHRYFNDQLSVSLWGIPGHSSVILWEYICQWWSRLLFCVFLYYLGIILYILVLHVLF